MGRILHNIGSRSGPRGVGWEVAALAERQHGVVTAAQLRELGLSNRMIDARVGDAQLHPIHLGVYTVGHRLLTNNGRYMAAVLAGGVGAALSHRSAADLWGLRRNSIWLEVTVPRSRDGRPGLTFHRPRVMHPKDFTRRDGIRTTTVARTLLDLGAVLPEIAVRQAVDRAERLDLFDGFAIEELLERVGPRRGTAKLRRAIVGWRPVDTRSPLEDQFQELLRGTELPAPQVNVLVEGERQQHEVDCYWPDHRLVVELDSYGFHRTRRDQQHDADMTADLELAGLRVVRLIRDDITVQKRRTLTRLGRILTREPVYD